MIPKILNIKVYRNEQRNLQKRKISINYEEKILLQIEYMVKCTICKNFKNSYPTHSLIHSLTHSFTHSFIDSFIHSFIYSFIHSFIHLFINSFIHSFIHSFDWTFMSLHMTNNASLPAAIGTLVKVWYLSQTHQRIVQGINSMRLKLSRTLADFAVIFKAYRSLGYPYVKYTKSLGCIFTAEPTIPLLRKTGCISCWYCGFTVTTTYNPCPNFGCYILCLTDWLALSPTLYANRKRVPYFSCIYQTEYSLVSVS